MDGAPVRDAILERLRSRIASAGNPAVCLATVLVGDDTPSQKYVASKHRTAESIGIRSVGVELPATASQAEVEAAVATLAADPSVHGILVQMPLPGHLDPERVLALIPVE